RAIFTVRSRDVTDRLRHVTKSMRRRQQRTISSRARVDGTDDDSGEMRDETRRHENTKKNNNSRRRFFPADLFGALPLEGRRGAGARVRRPDSAARSRYRARWP